jgi:glutaredoxin
MDSSSSAPVDPRPAQVTIVVSSGCHFCHDAEEVLEDLGRDFGLQVTRVDLRSPLGTELAQRHGAGMSPLVLLDGAFLSAGRLPRNKLRKLLTQRAERVRVAAGSR